MFIPAPGDPVPNSVTPGGCRGASTLFSEKALCLCTVTTMTQKMSPLVEAAVSPTDILKCIDQKQNFEEDRIQLFKEQGKNALRCYGEPVCLDLPCVIR